MTETAGLLALNPRRCPRLLGSVGVRLPFSEVEIRSMAGWAESGEPGDVITEPGRPGMVVARGPAVFDGYLESRHNEGCFTADGGLVTGDLGYLDAEGRLFLSGRAKDVIIRGGHNIDPGWIEQAALSLPEVAAAVAVGRPDAYAGEVPVLFVVATPGTELQVDRISSAIRERIAEPPAHPKAVIAIEQIPLTAVGKPFRPELRRRAAERHLRSGLSRRVEDGTFGKQDRETRIDVELGPGGLEVRPTAGASSEVLEWLQTYPLRLKPLDLA